MFSAHYNGLAIQRLQMLQKKKGNLVVQDRKKIAEDLENGKEEMARVRVEQVIRDDYLIEAYELLEMYCSMISSRFGLIDSVRECDAGISEAVTSIIWATPRIFTEVPEMRVICDQFTLRYGKQFAQQALDNHANSVCKRIVNKLSISTPHPMLVDGYLETIALKYNVPYHPPARDSELHQEEFLIDVHHQPAAPQSPEPSNIFHPVAATPTQTYPAPSHLQQPSQPASSGQSASSSLDFAELEARFLRLKQSNN